MEIITHPSKLYEEQAIVHNEIVSFIVNKNNKPDHALILGAPGGHGKTFVLNAALKTMAHAEVFGSVVAYTGRAASQLRKSGVEATTLHSKLYTAVLDDDGDLLYFRKKEPREILDSVGSFMMADEGSMIPKEIASIMLGLKIPTIFAGDYAQLPAIDPENPNFNVMFDIQGDRLELKTNRRVCEGSEGILYVTSHLRENNSIPRRVMNGYSIVKQPEVLNSVKFHENNQYDVIVCGTNKVRKKINNMVRRSRGLDDEIAMVGETVMCLKNGIIGERNINNGELFRVESVIRGEPRSIFGLVNIDTNEKFYVDVYNETWQTEQIPQSHNRKRHGNVQQFCFGYAVSCHKIQGSTIENVLFYDEDTSYFLDRQKFRYTACSRASRSLTVAM